MSNELSFQAYTSSKLDELDCTAILDHNDINVFFSLKNVYRLNMTQLLSVFNSDAMIVLCLILTLSSACLARIYSRSGTANSCTNSIASVLNLIILKHSDYNDCTSSSKRLLFITLGVLVTIIFNYTRAGIVKTKMVIF